MSWLADIRVIDTDTHLSEPADLWSSRAPAGYATRLPHVVDVDGQAQWVIEGALLGPVGGSACITPEGGKTVGLFGMGTPAFEKIHPGAYRVPERLEIMDQLGIWGHILYPNVAGFGAATFIRCTDSKLRVMSAEIYNDAMAEWQEESGGRIMGMGLIPWWDLDAAVREVRRVASLGLHGIVMCWDPHHHGLPDLGEAAWNRYWEACVEESLPVNFHIGSDVHLASALNGAIWHAMNFESIWATVNVNANSTNARIIANLVFSGVFERFPELRTVTVESGVGWLPFFLEVMDHNWRVAKERGQTAHLSLTPSEYCRRHVFANFWFERDALRHTIEVLGPDNVIFETDWPHVVCLYPNTMEYVAESLANFDLTTRRKILQDNAAGLYHVSLPEPAVA
jgi:predicted TIM-barrel fold metal-dependent hydrolase